MCNDPDFVHKFLFGKTEWKLSKLVQNFRAFRQRYLKEATYQINQQEVHLDRLEKTKNRMS